MADLIDAPPSIRHHIVWLAFAPAEVSSPVVSLASLQLFDGPWLRERVERSQLEGLPAELMASRDRFSATDLPNHERFVLARVDLGLSRDTNPVETAETDTRALVAAASLKRGRRRWRLMEGYLHAEDGQFVGLGSFYFHEKQDHSIGDSTETFLRELATDLGGVLRPSSHEMRAFLAEVDQLQDDVDRNDPSMVLTLVRLLELVNSRVTGAAQTWQQFASRYFEHAWVRQQVFGSLTHLARMAEGTDSLRYFDRDPASRLESLGNFIEFNPGGTWNAHLDRTFDALSILKRRARIHSSEGRRWIEVADYLESTASARRWIASLGKDFRASLARLKRVRDASIHGGPVTTSAPSALVFCQTLTFGALGWTLDALISGRSVREVFEEESRSAREWTHQVSTGRSLRSALFGLT